MDPAPPSPAEIVQKVDALVHGLLWWITPVTLSLSAWMGAMAWRNFIEGAVALTRISIVAAPPLR